MSVVRYGSFAFDAGESSWRTNVTTEYAGMIPTLRVITVSLTGKILGSSATELANRSRLLQNAFWQVGRDLTLTDDSGVVIESLRSGNSLSGVTCIEGPSFPEGEGAEFVTYRTFTATFQAKYQAQANQALVYNWTQSVTQSGGGPLIVWQPAVTGRPVKVIAQEATTYRATQTGSAMGLIGYPPVPPPAFGAGNLSANPDITYTAPRRVGNGLTDFAVSWTYQFESAGPLKAGPGVPP